MKFHELKLYAKGGLSAQVPRNETSRRVRVPGQENVNSNVKPPQMNGSFVFKSITKSTNR